MKEIFRNCVGIVVFNNDKKVLLCERRDQADAWQFPQGGVEDNESFLQAAARELREETSITSVELIGTIEEPLRYRFPPEPRLKHVGQDMRWVLYRFTGKNTEINLATAAPEFRNFRWEDLEVAPKKIIGFKRDVYLKVVEQFKPLLESYSYE